MVAAEGGTQSPFGKLRLKPGMAAYVYGVPESVVDLMTLPTDVRDLRVASGEVGGPPAPSTLAEADFALAFAGNQEQAVRRLAELEPAIQAGAVVWIAYPKGSKAAGYDVSRDTIWRAANEVGAVLNANVAIDGTWSAVRVRKAKPGELG